MMPFLQLSEHSIPKAAIDGTTMVICDIAYIESSNLFLCCSCKMVSSFLVSVFSVEKGENGQDHE